MMPDNLPHHLLDHYVAGAIERGEAPIVEQRDERADILAALARFIRQRPGLEYANYRDPAVYRSESRSITRDMHHALILLHAVVSRNGITAGHLRESFRAFSGRLSWDGKRLDYCTGQYYPTEYRKAVCAVLASALWDYWRDSLPAEQKKADEIRRIARRELGRAIALRWFR